MKCTSNYVKSLTSRVCSIAMLNMTHNLFLRKCLWRVMSTGQKGRKDPEYPGYRTKNLIPTHSCPKHLLSLSLTTKKFPANAKADCPWWADFLSHFICTPFSGLYSENQDFE
jgi:hypothetical protein